MAYAYIKAFKSLNGWEPMDMEVRQHLDFQGYSRSHHGPFIFVDIGGEWFEITNKILSFLQIMLNTTG